MNVEVNALKNQTFSKISSKLKKKSLEELKSSILQQFYIYRRNSIPVYNGNVYLFCHKGI